MLIFRCIFPIQEIIIQGNSYRMKQVSRQLYLQNACKTSFPEEEGPEIKTIGCPPFISIGDLSAILATCFSLHRRTSYPA